MEHLGEPVRPVRLFQRFAQVLTGTLVIGIEPQGLLKTVERFERLAQIAERDAEIIEDRLVMRIEFERLAKELRCLRKLPLSAKLERQVSQSIDMYFGLLIASVF